MKRIITCGVSAAILTLATFAFAQKSVTIEDTVYLTLKDAKELCLAKNETVLGSRERLIERQADVGIARAGFLPSISLQGSYTQLGKIPAFLMEIPEYTFTPLRVYDFTGNLVGFTEPLTVMTGVDSMELEMGEDKNYLLRGTVQQPLFTWGTLLNSYRIAKINYEMEAENYRKVVNDVKLQVTQAYLGAYLSQETLALMRESYELMGRHVNQVEILYKNGMVQRLDVLRANVELSSLKTQVLRAERDKEIAFSTLKLLIGFPDDVPIILDAEIEHEPYDMTLDDAISIALKKRPDLAALRLTRELTEKALAIESAQNKPTIALVYNYDYKKPVSMAETDWGSDWNVTLAVSMPIFQGGAYFSKVKKRKSQLKQVDFNLSQYENLVRLDVKTNFLMLEQEQEILSYQEENVAQAKAAMELAEEQYNNGLITNLEYMDTQLALTRSKLEWLSSLVSYNVTKEKLIVSMGI